ncbi:MAG: ketopantoate reductase C-terminal domain-containing protein [Dehalococcoidia bacterium]
MRAAGIGVTLSDDARLVVWEKFLFLCPGAAITSITRMPFGAVLACEESREVLRRAVSEVAAVARAEGVSLPEDAVESTLSGIARYPATMRTSMERDLSAGRRIELDALSGAVVRHGRQQRRHAGARVRVRRAATLGHRGGCRRRPLTGRIRAHAAGALRADLRRGAGRHHGADGVEAAP